MKVRGYRIELGEIEAWLEQHPAVGQAIVVAREEANSDVRIVAYVRHKTPATAEQLRTHMRSKLPDFMVPAHVVAVDHFPMTPNAKIDRVALAKREDAAVGGRIAGLRGPR